MKFFNLLLIIAVSVIFVSKAALSLETKTIIDLQLAKKMADACEAKRATTDWRPLGIATVDFLVPFPGGLPIRAQNGDLIGAIGVSGATGDQDEECAQAALDSVKDMLK